MEIPVGPEIVIPVAVFASIVAVVWVSQHFSAKKRADAYATVRSAIEKGQEITPEAMESMTRLAHPLADLRRGVLLIALTIAFAALAGIVSTEDEEAVRPLLGISVFPLTLGLAYIGLHFFANPKNTP